MSRTTNVRVPVRPMIFRSRHQTYVSALLIARIIQFSAVAFLFVGLVWGIGREL